MPGVGAQARWRHRDAKTRRQSLLGLPDGLDHAGGQANAATQPHFVKIEQGVRIAQRLRQRLSGSFQQRQITQSTVIICVTS